MPKHKKTREQKILADKRREAYSTVLYSFSPKDLKQQTKPLSPIKPTTTIVTKSYQYLARDLRKTALITGIIVVAELALRTFIR